MPDLCLMLQVSSSSSSSSSLSIQEHHLLARLQAHPPPALLRSPMQRLCVRKKPALGLPTRLKMARCAFRAHAVLDNLLMQ
jgi:hypothetical protein